MCGCGGGGFFFFFLVGVCAADYGCGSSSVLKQMTQRKQINIYSLQLLFDIWIGLDWWNRGRTDFGLRKEVERQRFWVCIQERRWGDGGFRLR